MSSFIKLARDIGRLLVFSLSPANQNHDTSVLRGVERLVASGHVLFLPNSAARRRFVGHVVYWLVRFFSERYHQEQSGQLGTSPDRKIDDTLKRHFVHLLTEPVLLGCSSPNYSFRNTCLAQLKLLANLEPALIIPAPLHIFYSSWNSDVDGESAVVGLRMLTTLAPTMVESKWMRLHLQNLMELALTGINHENPNLTQVVGEFIWIAQCAFPWVVVAEQSDKQSTKLATKWFDDEIERLIKGGPKSELNHAKKMNDQEEAELLRSAFNKFAGFQIRLLKRVQSFYSKAYPPAFDHYMEPDKALKEPSDSLADAATECVRSLLPKPGLGPKLPGEIMGQLCSFVCSNALPDAVESFGRIVGNAVRADPGLGLSVFLPELSGKIRDELENLKPLGFPPKQDVSLMSPKYNVSWYIGNLAGSLMYGGSHSLQYKDLVLNLCLFVETKRKRASTAGGLVIGSLLWGLTQTYATTCVGKARATGGLEGCSEGWDPEHFEIFWHEPSPQEMEVACDVFDSQM